MSIPLTFVDKNLLNTTTVDHDGDVHYTTTTTTSRHLKGCKITTITSASGVLMGSEREWNWKDKTYTLKYHDARTLVQATANTGSDPASVRLTTYHMHLSGEHKQAAIYFPREIQDEEERMFLLMALLETETQRQDKWITEGFYSSLSPLQTEPTSASAVRDPPGWRKVVHRNLVDTRI
ncbi:hypothetical protein DFH06DRAFT_1131726 [Mycena polygramma]|nr:hypothetical protein DFH06DRAFT_1131726 [Mycena polygramma]